MRNFIATLVMSFPVLITLRTFLPPQLAWYESISVGVVAAMIAGAWVRGIKA